MPGVPEERGGGGSNDSCVNKAYNCPCDCCDQARRKKFRVAPAKIGSSTEGTGTLGGSGGMLAQEVLKFSFSKMHIWRILRENSRKK